MDTNSTSDWFDRINTAALTWYGVYAQNQPAPTTGAGSASVTFPRTGGVAASISLPVLLVGAAVILGAIYVYRRA